MLLHFCPALLFHFVALAIFRVEIYSFIINSGHNRRRGRHRYGPRNRTGETLRNFKAVRAYSRQKAAEEDYSKHLTFHANNNKLPGLMHQIWMGCDFFMQFLDNVMTNIYSGTLVASGVLSMAALQPICGNGRSLVW